MTHDQGFDTFVDPPREFGVIPFWFWNDDLEEGELIRQLRTFHEAGFGGVMPHARVGLSHRVGYLTDEYFRLMRVVVDEAARLGMKVILYDEGSYPSGSANGAVVAENANYASQSIRLWERDVEGPHNGFWRPNTGRAMKDRHVCTVQGKVREDGTVDPDTVTLLSPYGHTIFRIDVPEGQWKVMSVWNIASGGAIRGVFEESEDGHATAPPSGDLLNPDAVACFIRLTHDRYYEELKDHFGDTVIAMFTDEPNVAGRGGGRRSRGVKPFTPGFVPWLETLWGSDPTMWLPALWVDYGEGTEAFRHRYSEAIQTRLHEVFYAGQAEWCEAHGIALTGHPAESNDVSSLRLFQFPGQDMVWRYIEPNKATAIEGEHSVAAKAATSGARLSNRRRILTEVCGAYGWQLSLDEIKWLFDWHIVRGNNLINPHAVFYSIRDRRAWESEPDLAIHNVWWPHFGNIATYTRRLCWLLTDGEHVCDVAILGDGNNLSWRAAKQLYQEQIDFLYVDDRAVEESNIGDGQMTVGEQRYKVVIVEDLPVITDAAREKLDAFEASGGVVIGFEEGMRLAEKIEQAIDKDVHIVPAYPDLRTIHYRKEGLDFFLLVNEGEDKVAGEIQLSVAGEVEMWDGLGGTRRKADATVVADGVLVHLDLDRRESVVLVVDPSQPLTGFETEAITSEERVAVIADWTVRDDNGESVAFAGLTDWSRQRNWELFSGSLTYSADVEIPEADEAVLDLGHVGDIAEVFVDGVIAGVRMWAPHTFSLDGVGAGTRLIEIRVTNSMANAYEGMQLPSGIMGPISIVVKHRSQQGFVSDR